MNVGAGIMIWNGRNRNRMGYLISETTKEERERIVADSLGNISGACDGCSPGIIEMYQDYIDGKKELKDINMEFRASYVSGDIDKEKKAAAGICKWRILRMNVMKSSEESY